MTIRKTGYEIGTYHINGENASIYRNGSNSKGSFRASEFSLKILIGLHGLHKPRPLLLPEFFHHYSCRLASELYQRTVLFAIHSQSVIICETERLRVMFDTYSSST